MERLTIPSTLASLEGIASFVLAAAAKAGLDRRATYRLRLAVDEIATNVITHGYQEAGLTGDLVLESQLTPETLTVFLEDQSAPHDPRQHETPDVTLLPEHRTVGGLGTFLALRGVDEFRYEHIGGRNRTVFVVNRPAPDGHSPGSPAASAASTTPVARMGSTERPPVLSEAPAEGGRN